MVETHKRATIERRLVTIGQAHKLRGLPCIHAHPAVRAALRGMVRRYGRPKKQAAALGVPETIQIVSACEGTDAALRDRALFLMSFAGAFRRSEVARIRLEDLTFREGAVDVFLRQSKGDQESEGTIVTVLAGVNVATRPVAALQRWLRAAPTEGSVFRAVRADGTVMDEGFIRIRWAASFKSALRSLACSPGPVSASPHAGSARASSPGRTSADHAMRRLCLTRDIGISRRCAATFVEPSRPMLTAAEIWGFEASLAERRSFEF